MRPERQQGLSCDNEGFPVPGAGNGGQFPSMPPVVASGVVLP